MMKNKARVGCLLILFLASPLATLAQDSADEAPAKEATAGGVLETILGVILLPGAAQKAREAGVPEEDIRVILEESAEREMPPGDTRILFEETAEAVREHGPIDNFGAFVQARLGAGLRGRELAAAIRAEHQIRGKGKGHGKGHGKGKKNQDGGHQ